MKFKLFSLLTILLLSVSYVHAEDNTDYKASYNYKLSDSDLTTAEDKLKKLEASLLNELSNKPKETKTVEVKIKETKTIQEETTVQVENSDSELLKKLTDQEKLIAELENKQFEYEKNKIDISSKTRLLSNNNEKLRSKLIIAEAEVERLSSILEDHSNTLLGVKSIENPKKTKIIAETKNISYKQAEKTPEDMPIITVSVEKANLRTGPGTQHSPIMEVSKESRLVMEKRLGDWYRVIAPNGTRAWISANVVKFGRGLNGSPSETLQVSGVDSSIEDRAMKLIRRTS